jgi:hypothetical protein
MRDYDDYEDDYRYSAQAREADLRLVWRCDKCAATREDCPGVNEGGTHYGCGGQWVEAGESYLCD